MSLAALLRAGGTVTLTGTPPSVVLSLGGAALDRATRACMARLPNRCCNTRAGDGATPPVRRWAVAAAADRRSVPAFACTVVRSRAMKQVLDCEFKLPD